jgi:hypothetical protein
MKYLPLTLSNWSTNKNKLNRQYFHWFVFFRIHAITVCDNKKYFTDHINGTLNDVGLGSSVSVDDIIDIVDGYKGLGYGISTPEELGW